MVVDPSMAHMYITELPGQTSARGTKYSYSYESHIEQPESMAMEYTNFPDYTDDGNVERYSTSTQKVSMTMPVGLRSSLVKAA